MQLEVFEEEENISIFSFLSPPSQSLVWWTRETLGSGQVLGQTLHICCVRTTQKRFNFSEKNEK